MLNALCLMLNAVPNAVLNAVPAVLLPWDTPDERPGMEEEDQTRFITTCWTLDCRDCHYCLSEGLAL